jgi:hypothetical protein
MPDLSDHPDSSACSTACRSLKETNDKELYKGFRRELSQAKAKANLLIL